MNFRISLLNFFHASVCLFDSDIGSRYVRTYYEYIIDGDLRNWNEKAATFQTSFAGSTQKYNFINDVFARIYILKSDHRLQKKFRDTSWNSSSSRAWIDK